MRLPLRLPSRKTISNNTTAVTPADVIKGLLATGDLALEVALQRRKPLFQVVTSDLRSCGVRRLGHHSTSLLRLGLLIRLSVRMITRTQTTSTMR